MSVPYQITKLSANNYTTWATDIRFLLLEKNCYDIVTGTEVEPEGEEVKAEVRDFNIRKRLALSTIYLNISPEYRKIIETLDDPKEVWSTLARNFRPDNRAYHMSLFSDLFACRIEKNETINLFSSRILQIGAQLEDLGKPVEELYLSYQLLRHLPSKFDPVVQNILRWSDNKFTYQKILLELIAEETRLRLRNQDRAHSDVSRQEAFFVEKPRRRCPTCKKFHHPSQKCWYPHPVGRGRGNFSRGKYRSPSPQNATWSSPSRSDNSSSYVFNDSQDPSSREDYPRQSRSRHHSPYRRSSPETSPSPPRSSRRSRKAGTSYGRTGKGKMDSKGKMSFFVAEANISDHSDDNVWIFDTAASHHFCKNRELFTNFKSVKNESMVLAVNGVEFPIKGRGDIEINFGYVDCVLKDVLYSPKLRRNLLSGSKLDQNGFSYSGRGGRITAWDGDKVIFKAKLDRALYYVFPLDNYVSNVEHSNYTNDKLTLWHSKFGHANLDYIVRTSQLNAVKGMPALKKLSDFTCEPCRLNKHRKVSFHSIEDIRSKQPLELLYLDVWGPVNIEGRKGERYYLSIVDDYSRRIALYPMTEKSDVFDIFEGHVKRAERSLNLRVKAIRTDNGSEFVNRNFYLFCSEMGIKHEKTNPYTPQQNGVAERLNRTVVDGARTMLYESNLDKSFWPEAVLAFVHVWNRLCHQGQSKTPIELYTGSKPSVRHLREFGSTVYVGVPKQLRGKLDPKARKGVVVGYALGTKGYRVFLPDLEKVVETCDVSFPRSEQSGNGAALAPENNTYNWTDQSEEPGEQHDVYLPRSNPGDELGVYHPGTPRSPLSSQSSSSAEDTDEEEDEGDGGAATAKMPAKETTWSRIVVRRPDGSRNDVYYYNDNHKSRFKTLKEIEKHCKSANLKYDPSLFNFSGKDLFQGPVNPQPSTSGVQCKNSTS